MRLKISINSMNGSGSSAKGRRNVVAKKTKPKIVVIPKRKNDPASNWPFCRPVSGTVETDGIEALIELPPLNDGMAWGGDLLPNGKSPYSD